jgi:hypothetical protein
MDGRVGIVNPIRGIGTAGLILAALTLTGCGSAVETVAPTPTPTPTPFYAGEDEPFDCDAPVASKWGKALRHMNNCDEQEENKYGIEVRDGNLYIDGEYVAPPGSEWEYDPEGRSDGGPKCVWSPTMNRDWHDDYVCGGDRKYFLPDDNFVEQWEIDAAAREWERANR